MAHDGMQQQQRQQERHHQPQQHGDQQQQQEKQHSHQWQQEQQDDQQQQQRHQDDQEKQQQQQQQYDQQQLQQQQDDPEQQQHPPRRRRRRRRSRPPFLSYSFWTKYRSTGNRLGEGAAARVEECVERRGDGGDGRKVAVKIIEKTPGVFRRSAVLKEIEHFHLCRGQQNILQLLEYFEEPSAFYLVFEKMSGGPLLDHIQRRGHFSEEEAAAVTKDLARALQFLHQRGIAHRDLKPENVLCVSRDSPNPVKLCDFDLTYQNRSTPAPQTGGTGGGGGGGRTPGGMRCSTPKMQTPVGSLEYMAPEVLKTFLVRDDDDDDGDDDGSLWYDKKCDLWSLGVLLHILLSGSPPFAGSCGRHGCGWDHGEACTECQSLLTESIRCGAVSFSGAAWRGVSPGAKDLCARMLQRDAARRIDTRSLLNHPWIRGSGGGPDDPSLGTPKVLSRQTSLRELSEFARSVLDIKRAISCEEEEEPAFANGDGHNTTTTPSLDLELSRMRRSRLNNSNKISSSSAAVREFSSIGEEENHGGVAGGGGGGVGVGVGGGGGSGGGGVREAKKDAVET